VGPSGMVSPGKETFVFNMDYATSCLPTLEALSEGELRAFCCQVRGLCPARAGVGPTD